MSEENDKPSPTCGVVVGKKDGQYLFCGAKTSHAYPAMGGGYMALCREHSRKHPGAWPVQEI